MRSEPVSKEMVTVRPYWEVIQSETREVGVNLAHLKNGSHWWSLNLAKRTGVYVDGNEVREVYAWFHYSKTLSFELRRLVLRWLFKNVAGGLFFRVNKVLEELDRKFRQTREGL